MNETEQQIVIIKVEGDDARFYWKRLVDSISLRYDIEHGVYPIKTWNATEPDGSPLADGAVNVLPIKYTKNKMTGQPILGLRHGVLHAIDGSYEWLKENGYGKEAQMLVDADRDRSKKEGLL